MKVTEIFWSTKIQLSFQCSSAAALIKKLSDRKSIKFCGTSGHPFWIRANCRRFRQRRVRKIFPQNGQFQSNQLSTVRHFCNRDVKQVYGVRGKQFKVQTLLWKRNIYIGDWTENWKFFVFSEKIHGVWAKNFWQRFQNRNLHVQLFILRKVYFWGNFFSKITLNFNRKK